MPILAPPERPTRRAPCAGLASVACPDARPPAYRAASGLAEAGRLGRFHTGFYYGGDDLVSSIASRVAPGPFGRVRSRLDRRRDPEIPASRVASAASFDASLAIENRFPASRLPLSRWRTRRFDRASAVAILRDLPDAALFFSDVGSEFAIPACRDAGIRAVLSIVHGDVIEERELIGVEAERSPDFFPIYLGDGPVEPEGLSWLHDRRLAEARIADRLLVPSEHIAGRLIARGTPEDRVRVVPYAADLRRFRPSSMKAHPHECVFLFAGGITQRKGIKYLLEAWRLVRRPGWALRLVGALPGDPTPLEPYRDEVEWLGRVGHAEMPRVLASADVFVFPSLFEGSAVVTYEALACGLPSVVTPDAGSVVRDGVEGFLVPPADVASLAERMERLGSDPGLRESMATNARARAEEYGWARYQASIISALFDPVGWDDLGGDRRSKGAGVASPGGAR